MNLEVFLANLQFLIHTFHVLLKPACLFHGQASKGKVQAINQLRSELMEQLEKHMPTETQEYR
jgi:hypothetical protein